MAKKNFNLKLSDEEVGREFYAFIGPKGIKKGYALTGAIRLFMLLPAEVREMLIEKGRTEEAIEWLDNLTASGSTLAVMSGSAAPSKPRASHKAKAAGRLK